MCLQDFMRLRECVTVSHRGGRREEGKEGNADAMVVGGTGEVEETVGYAGLRHRVEGDRRRLLRAIG
jgi:hypothetical protein